MEERLGPHDSLWETQNGIWPFIYHRVNPTRHVLAYCMGWPKEANRAVLAMKSLPPKVIEFRPLAGFDGVSSLLWNPVITEYLFENYRPVPGRGILEPSPSRWRGWTSRYEDFSAFLQLKELPSRWGDSLLHFSPRRERTQVIPVDTPQRGEHEGRQGQIFAMDVEPTPRDHLLLRLSITDVDAASARFLVRFAGKGGTFDSFNRIDFQVHSKGSNYLIPVGLSPGWAWRDRIAAIEITAEDSVPFTVDQAEIWSLSPAK